MLINWKLEYVIETGLLITIEYRIDPIELDELYYNAQFSLNLQSVKI
jgi:hypothetical protein